MLLVTLLLSLAFAQEYDQCNEHFADVEDARACCQAKGLDLCTNGQVHQVVFGTGGLVQMCFSAFMDGGEVGWWNADPNFCSGYGFKSYRDPSGPGAHCCDGAVLDVTPTTCQAAGPTTCSGTRILLDSQLGLYCPDGACSDEFCCQDFTPAAVYKHHGGQYDFATATEALAGCTSLHPDYQLCTKTQILALSDAGYGERVCSSAWHYDDEAGDFSRGWLVSEADAADGWCGSRAGWRTWAPSSGEGSAHCCVASYTNGGYGSLGELTGLTDEERTQKGRDYCEASSYPYTLCTYRQMLQVAYTGEATNICMSGRLENPLEGDENDPICGWEQVDAGVCGNGSTGFKGWCPDTTGAHCCLDYVSGWYPSYTKDSTGYDMHPDQYYESDFNSLAAANAFCTANGYTGVCTVEQVKYVAENQGEFPENQGCRVGWVTDDGAAASGYWGTACGRDDAWYDAWQPPAGQNPVAHCCDEDVPSSSRAPPVLDPFVKATGLYQFSDASQVQNVCDAANGYSLCTRDQVETVATVGVTRSDGSVQLETNMCYQGFMADGSFGWYQVDATCGNGKTGWRFFNGNADAFCCLDFASQVGTQTVAPTLAPSVPVYTFIGEYTYQDAEEAQAACVAENANYVLCNDDEVYTIATVGQVVDAEGFSGVAANQDCKSGWVEPSDDEPQYNVGWFQSNPTCGGGRKFGQWNSWALVDAESSSGKRAGAHCCIPALIDSVDHPAVVETTTSPTEVATDAPEPETVAPTEQSTQAPETVSPTEVGTEAPQTTEYVRYSDLPSTEQEPEGCVRRDDLTPVGFEGVVVYCATTDLIYVNGRSTCVATSDPDAAALVLNAFENDWYLAQDGETCGDKSYDMATDDQLFITNHMLNNLEDDIDELEVQMAGESANLDTYLATWKTEVAVLITDSLDNFDATTQAALQNYIRTNLSGETED